MTLIDALSKWDPGFSSNQRDAWRLDVRSELRPPQPGSNGDEDWDDGLAWTLVGWCEESVTDAVRADDLDILELAVIGLGRVPQRFIDRRELLLIGSLVRRAVELLRGTWAAFRQRFAEDGLLLELVDGFPAAVSPKTHREHGSGAEFWFEKIPLHDWSVEELLRRLSNG